MDERNPEFYINAWLAGDLLQEDAKLWFKIYDEAYKSLKDVVKGRAALPPNYIGVIAQSYAEHQASDLLARAHRAASS